MLYHGTKAEREDMQALIKSPSAKRRKLSEKKTAEVKGYPIVITSFEIAINDRKFLQAQHVRLSIPFGT